MNPDEAVLLPATQLSTLLSTGEVTSVQLTQAYIQRAKRFARLNAYVTLDDAGALAQAEAADRRLKAGERATLLGLPIAVKDQLDVKGVRTTAGSKLVDYVADQDCVAVSLLRHGAAQ